MSKSTTVVIAIVAFILGVLVDRLINKPSIVPPTPATISYNNGNCTQSPASMIQVSISAGESVVWFGANAAQPVTVTFATSGAQGPFRNSSYSSNSPSGVPTGPVGSYPFSSVTVNGQSCNNPQSMGVSVQR